MFTCVVVPIRPKNCFISPELKLQVLGTRLWSSEKAASDLNHGVIFPPPRVTTFLKKENGHSA